MGLFTRRPRDGPVSTTTTHSEKLPRQRARREPLHLSYEHRPRVGEWFRYTWKDLVAMAIMGAIGLGINAAPPAAYRNFPITFQDGEIVDPEFSYPLRVNIIPHYAATIIAIFIPLSVFLLCQIRVRSFWDVNNALIGLIYSLVSASLFQVTIKWLIGGFRPHFLSVCEPVIPPGLVGSGYRQIMFDISVCTGNEGRILEALKSMPSGHTTASFAGLIYLSLYLNGKLKTWSNHHASLWKLAATYAPVLGATLIAGSLTVDEMHNWYDCVAGATIGTGGAISAYRMVYASVWDFRFNHIPMNRNLPFVYAARPMELADAVFTRKAGWGTDEATFGGAPGDANGSMGVRGATNGAVQGGYTNGRTSIDRRPVGGWPAGSWHARGDNMV